MARALPSPDRSLVLPPAFAAIRPATAVAAFVAGYLFLDWLSNAHAIATFGVTPWNPQPALAIALLLYAGQRLIPVVFAAVVLAEVLVRGAPAPPLATLFAAAAVTFGYAATAQWLAGRHGPRLPLVTPGDLARLFTGIAGGTLLTGTLYIGTLIATGYAPPGPAPQGLLQFWIGDCVGLVVTLPLLLTLADAGRRERLARSAVTREAASQVAVLALLLWLLLRGPPADEIRFFYILFLPVVWVAARHGLAGAALAIAAIQAGIAIEVHGADYRSIAVFELQAELIALTVTGLFLGITVDERRRVGEDLRRSLHLAAAGRMAAALAHELNQPLTALTGYAASARRIAAAPAPPDPQVLAGTLDRVGEEAQRAAHVVRRMRDFFRTGAVELAPVRLDTLLAALVGSLQEPARDRGVQLRLAVQPVPVVLADALQVEIVLRNLVTNAFEALAGTAGPRAVDVDVRAAGGAVAVTVRDNGPGVALQSRARLFEPFATTRATGMGMGLAISRAIVEAHGGHLLALDGPGGAFRFTLPAGVDADA